MTRYNIVTPMMKMRWWRKVIKNNSNGYGLWILIKCVIVKGTIWWWINQDYNDMYAITLFDALVASRGIYVFPLLFTSVGWLDKFLLYVIDILFWILSVLAYICINFGGPYWFYNDEVSDILTSFHKFVAFSLHRWLCF